MKKTDRTPSLLRAAHAYPVIVLALLTVPACGPGEAAGPAPSPLDGKAARASFAGAPKGFGPSPKEPLGKTIVDVQPQTKPRRR